MSQESDDHQSAPVETEYTPDQDRSLSNAILDAIESYKGEELTHADFVLYDDINPDALDNLFQHDAEPRTTVGFNTDDVRVELYGDGGIQIHVRERPE